MTPISFLLELLKRVPAVVRATASLVKAVRTPEPPPPPPLNVGAEEYLRGRNAEEQRRHEYDRIPRATEQLQKKEEPEEPVS